MSWSARFPEPVRKHEAEAAIDALKCGYEDGGKYGLDDTMAAAMTEQLRVAKNAAKLLLAAIPGPYVSLLITGHANGSGSYAREGSAPDVIDLTIAQIAPLKARDASEHE